MVPLGQGQEAILYRHEDVFCQHPNRNLIVRICPFRSLSRAQEQYDLQSALAESKVTPVLYQQIIFPQERKMIEIHRRINGKHLDHTLIQMLDATDSKWQSTLMRKIKEMHQKGILHNDLHCGNIMIDMSHEPWIVDLGHATWIGVKPLKDRNCCKRLDLVLLSKELRGCKIFESEYQSYIQQLQV